MLGMLGVLLVGLATLLYWLGKRRYSYWKVRGVTQPPLDFGFGHFKDAYFGRHNHGIIINKIYRSFPKASAVGIYEFFTPKLLARSPEIIKKVLVSDFSRFHDNEFYVTQTLDPYFYKDPFVVQGDEWKPARANLTPLLSQKKMKEIYPTLKEVVPRLYQYINENLDKEFEVKEIATLFTMDAISSTVFGISSNCFTDPNTTFRKIADIQLIDQLQGFLQTTILFRLQALRDFIGFRFVPKSVSNVLEDMVSQVMSYRLTTKTVRSDLMQYLVDHKSEAGSIECMEIATVFFVEAFETSGMIASGAFAELALNPHIQDTLHEELDRAVQEKGDLDFDTLWSFPYLDKVVKESLRKHAVMYTYQRVCTKNTTLNIDGKAVDIEKGTTVYIPALSVHYDPEYYPDPDVFDPERFSDENIASRPTLTFIPFGEGPRICPGFRLGMIQVKLFLAHVVLKYRILATEKCPSQLTYDPSAFLAAPNEKRWVRLEARA